MLQGELHRRRRMVAAMRAQGEALQEACVSVLPANAEVRPVHLTAGEQVELRSRGVEVGGGAVAEPGESEVGVGDRHTLCAGAVGDVGEMIDRDVVVTRVGIGVVATGGLESVEDHRADFLSPHGRLIQREAERPVAHVAEVRVEFIADVHAVGAAIECDGGGVGETGLAAGEQRHGYRAAMLHAQRFARVGVGGEVVQLQTAEGCGEFGVAALLVGETANGSVALEHESQRVVFKDGTVVAANRRRFVRGRGALPGQDLKYLVAGGGNVAGEDAQLRRAAQRSASWCGTSRPVVRSRTWMLAGPW